MKKVFRSFLMIIMLMPGLSVDWVLGTSKARAALTMPDRPCACQIDRLRAVPKAHLFKDYSKAHIYKSVQDCGVQQPDRTGQTFHGEWGNCSGLAQIWFPNRLSIRGPPPDWPEVSQLQPSVLLTTLRLRV